MILAICSDKGSPGVTTLATVLALAWPGERLLLEADPSGGDLSLRMHLPGTQFLAREPSMLSLAMAVRGGARAGVISGYAQTTHLGIPVIPGPSFAEEWDPVLGLWDQIAATLQEWPGTAIVDLGRLQPGHPGFAMAEAADMVLLLVMATTEGLWHGRRRAEMLQRSQEAGEHLPQVGVVVRATRKGRGSFQDADRVLKDLLPVLGAVADDPSGVQMLLGGSDLVNLHRSALMRSGKQLVARLLRKWLPPETADRRVDAGRQARSPMRLVREGP